MKLLKYKADFDTSDFTEFVFSTAIYILAVKDIITAVRDIKTTDNVH